MILGFTRVVPICAVSAAVMDVFQSEKEIYFNGRVARAGVYINYCQQVNLTSAHTVEKIPAGVSCKTAHLCFVLYVTQQFVEIQK